MKGNVQKRSSEQNRYGLTAELKVKENTIKLLTENVLKLYKLE
jgi:hypothetical protein